MPDKEGGTLLSWAIESGSKEVVEFLLVNGARTDIRYFRDLRRIVLDRTGLKTMLDSLSELFEDLVETLEVTRPKQVSVDLLLQRCCLPWGALSVTARSVPLTWLLRG